MKLGKSPAAPRQFPVATLADGRKVYDLAVMDKNQKLDFVLSRAAALEEQVGALRQAVVDAGDLVYVLAAACNRLIETGVLTEGDLLHAAGDERALHVKRMRQEAAPEQFAFKPRSLAETIRKTLSEQRALEVQRLAEAIQAKESAAAGEGQ